MNSQTWHGEVSSLQRSRGTSLILSVDDEAAVLYTRQAILQDAGYEMLNAADGDQALHMFASYSACIDLVLVDYSLPGRDGSMVAEEMKRRKPGVPIILVSATATELASLTCVDGRINKGQSPTVLLDAIARLLTALQNRLSSANSCYTPKNQDHEPAHCKEGIGSLRW
jgi:two-component system alkaline phosphatase synthesis response regulator PhoP